MKLIAILVFIIHALVWLLIATGNILAFLTRVLVNDEDEPTNRIGNHFTIGGNAVGDDTDIIKRTENQYVSDRDIAVYDRAYRH